MADTYTAHYTLTKPQIGIYDAAWGTKWAANLDAIDAALWKKWEPDANGNYGVGVTPNAWAGGYKAIDVLGYGASLASGGAGTTSTVLTHNAWFNGTNWIYGYTGVAPARYQQTGAAAGSVHTLSVATSGTAGNPITWTPAFQADANGIGYPTGAGGTVTQATSKSTAVTLNKPVGQITMNGASLAAGASVAFYLNNTTIAAADTVVVTANNVGYADEYEVKVYLITAGECRILVTKATGLTRSDALPLNFMVLKGATS